MYNNRIVKNLSYLIAFSGLIALTCSRTKEVVSPPVITRPAEETEKKAQTTPVQELFETPPPDIGENDFFKIQIFATQKYDRAQAEKKRLRDITDKNIYLVKEKNLWKVQIGDYTSRNEAEEERELIRRLGWVDAWLIQYRISTKSGVSQEKPTLAHSETPPMFFTVQLIATTNKTEAENMHNNLKLLSISDTKLFREGDFWKIQAGRFDSYNEAVKMLDQMRKMGFNDSWIIKRVKR